MPANLSFFARERELQVLEEAYREPIFQFVVLYGRRRVGKTYLLKKFVEGKPNVFFFTAQRTTPSENLAYLSRAIYAQLANTERAIGVPEVDGPDDLGYLAIGSDSAPTYPNLASAFSDLFNRARARSAHLGRPIIVIDEYPELAKGKSSASSLLQTIIDHTKDESDIMLVLCGSSISFMKNEVLGAKSPLYGRRTREMELKPMDAFDAARVLARSKGPLELCAGLTARKIVEMYGVAGGIPLYLQQFEPSRSMEANLARHLFDQSALLYHEPTNYLAQSIVALDGYNAVLSAVANGARRPKDIAAATGIAQTSLGMYLRTLENLRILVNVRPVPAKNGGRPGYAIADNLFRAWYGFTSRYASSIEAGDGARVAAFVMQRQFPTYMGHVFEDVCRQWVAREMSSGQLPWLVKDAGSWWGTNPATREQEDIDVALTTHDGVLVLGECKWRNERMDVEALRTLEQRAAQFGATQVQLFGFSRSGFTEGAKAYAKERPSLRLVGLDELFFG